MTAPASIPALIAEGRRLIAAATPGPLKKWGKPDPAQAIEANGRFVATTLGWNDVANADIFVFAVNNLTALLAVAEAAVEWEAADAEQRRVPEWSRDTDLFERMLFRYQSATRALRAAVRGEEKTQ